MKASFLSGIILVCALSIVILFVKVIAPNYKTIEIGPNSPYLWKSGEKITGEGEIFLESENIPVTISFLDENKDKRYLTHTIEGETPLGQNPTFYGKFQAVDNIQYRTDGEVSIYAITSMSLKVVFHPTFYLWYIAIFFVVLCICFYYLPSY